MKLHRKQCIGGKKRSLCKKDHNNRQKKKTIIFPSTPIKLHLSCYWLGEFLWLPYQLAACVVNFWHSGQCGSERVPFVRGELQHGRRGRWRPVLLGGKIRRGARWGRTTGARWESTINQYSTLHVVVLSIYENKASTWRGRVFEREREKKKRLLSLCSAPQRAAERCGDSSRLYALNK